MTLLGRRGECEVLDTVLADAFAGRSRVVVLRGQAGVGKSALLEYVTGHADGWRVATAVGVESEMELPYSGLHQLCSPMLDQLEELPVPQRDALRTVFGLSDGPPPDRFLVALATLTLLAAVSEQGALLCVVDDAQWLDEATATILGFVGRRLLAERIALIVAARSGIGDEILAALPTMSVGGLADDAARKLLLDNLRAPLDPAICEQIITESHGNPLALLELPRTWAGTDVAGGYGLPTRQLVASRIEQSYATRLRALPPETRQVVVAASAEPLGDRHLLVRAAAELGLNVDALGPAIDAGLLQVAAGVEFAHPLVRSASYHSASADERRRVHDALARVTDAERDPDRRAWHRARAAAGPDEDVALELERSAGRAQARGGLAAAAAFLQSAAELSPEPSRRALRALEAADAKQLAGAPQAASTLLAAASVGPLDELNRALARRLEGQIALDLRRIAEAAPLLLDAARSLEALEPELARDTYLEAIRAATLAGRLGGDGLRRAAEAAATASADRGDLDAADVLLAGLAARFTRGYAAAAPLLQRAIRAFRAEDRLDPDLRRPGFARAVALELFDDDCFDALCTRSVRAARERGALGVLPLALDYLASARCFEGALDAATSLVEESDAIIEAAGGAPYGMGRFPLLGMRGDEAAVRTLVQAIEPVATARGEGALLTKGEYARALLYNGLGRYDDALCAAQRASQQDGETFSVHALSELVEAAVRAGNDAVAMHAVERLEERTQAAGTEWALAVRARARALVRGDDGADDLYQEAIARLERCRVAVERARTHLLYGEWLRRGGRRVDARVQLRCAEEMFGRFGMNAFGERTRRELAATGEKVRRRTAEARDELTAQEAQIAGLAREGHSNPEIASQLFLSPRTVEWHLRKVFAKLGISSRKELDEALRARTPQPA